MISVIIPTLNEESALAQTLKAVFAQQAEFEVIVVDGGSSDDTLQVVAQSPRVEAISAPRGRAQQMNAGAQHANGEWLLFLHADTWLPPDALEAVASLARSVQAGCFQQQFSRRHWFLDQVSRLHNWRCRRSQIIYGDQCLFIRPGLFERIGGFAQCAILEDVEISERILEHCNPCLLSQSVVTSSRKFEQRGLYRSFLDIAVILCCYELRLPIFRQGFFAPYR